MLYDSLLVEDMGVVLRGEGYVWVENDYNSSSAKCLNIHLEMEWVDLLTVAVADNLYGQAYM